MSARLLFAMARADFRERSRRPSFLGALLGAVYFGYLINKGWVNLTIQGQRGQLGSAWVGTIAALSAGIVLPLFGFYLIKGAIESDRRTGVGEILAATPLGRVAYTCGKTASNFAYLSVLVAILGAAGLVLQAIAGEDRRLDVVALAAPLVLLALPPVALTAALAVLFEAVRFLRGTFGNVLYFCAWAALLALAVQSPAVDLLGWQLVQRSIHQKVTTLAPVAPGQSESTAFQIGPQGKTEKTFRWDGIDWTPGTVARRLVLGGLAAAVALAAAPFFGRFDPAKEGGRRPVREGTEGTEEAAATRRKRRFRLPQGSPTSPFLALVTAELRLLLQGRNGWWYLVAAGLLIAQLAAPLEVVRTALLPVAWLWPLGLWAEMGTRERRWSTEALVFPSPRSAAFGTAAAWTAGVLLAVATGAGAGLRFLIAGDAPGLLAWAAACLFVPALAFGLGTLSGSSRPFEVVYLLLWYIGPLNHVPDLDYVGATEKARAAGLAWIWIAAAVFALAVGYAVRARRSRGT